MTDSTPPPARFTRRRVLLGAGALLVVGCSSESATDDGESAVSSTTSAATSAGSSGDGSTTIGNESGSDETEPATEDGESADVDVVAFTPADFEGLATCALFPETTAGPFPLDEQFDRRDITEGYPGHPLRLGLRVVDADCSPVEGAAVEVWHTDASGDYSAFDDGGGGKDEGAGTTFLRGTQSADADGIVEFATIYPGWYRGRAVHVHLRVHVGGNTALTSQLFFDDDYTVEIYSEDAYAEFGPPDTTNEQDGIAGDVESDGTLLRLTPGPTRAGAGTIALANVGIA